MSLPNCPACGSPYRDWQRKVVSKPSEAHKFCVNPWHFQDGPPKLPVDSREFKFKEATGMQHPNFEEPDYSAFARDELRLRSGKRSGRPVRMPLGGPGRSFPGRDMAYAKITYDVLDELKRAEAKFPDQSLPWGGDPQRHWGMVGRLADIAQVQRAVVNSKLQDGNATWFDVIAEEFLEAGAESGRSKDPDDDPVAAFGRLKAELTQVAAMVIRAIADLEQRRMLEEKAAAAAMKAFDPLPRGRTSPGDLGYSKPHPLDRYVADPYDVMKGGVSDADEWKAEAPLLDASAEVPDGRGKHAGGCRCKGCEEPDAGETNACVTGLNFPADDESIIDEIGYTHFPPNAGSAS